MTRVARPASAAALTDLVQITIEIDTLTRKLDAAIGTGGTDADIVTVPLTKGEIALILSAIEMAVGGASVS